MFLVRLSANFPPDMDPDVKADLIAREKAFGQEFQRSGKRPHLWRVVGPKMCNIGVWDVSISELNETLNALPMRPYIDVEVDILDEHPSVLKDA